MSLFILTNISIVLLITTVFNLICTYVAWGRAKTKTGFYFALGLTGLTFWTLAVGLGYAAVPLELKIFFAKLDAVGYHVALVLLLLCVMYFAGLSNWADNIGLRAFLFTIPALSVLIIITNEVHGWVWQDFIPVGNNVVVFEHGPGFIFVQITGYLLLTSMVGILIWVSRKGSDIQRRQARFLVFASAFPLLANIVYIYGIQGYEGVDWSSVTFSVTGLLFLLALHFARFVDITPIARDHLVASLGDGMVVVDTQKRIIDMNPTADKIFGVQRGSMIGTNLQVIAPLTHALLENLSGQEIRTDFDYGLENKRHFDVLISPLLEQKQKTLMGYLILYRDITERMQNELQLKQLTQAMEQSQVSVVITDLEGTITYVNQYFTTLTGYTAAEAIGKSSRIVQSGQTTEDIYQEMWHTIQAGHAWRGEILNKKKNGELYWELESIAPIFTGEGKIISFVAVKEDITNRKQAEAKLQLAYAQLEEQMKEIQELQDILREQAIRDALTGLYNRHYLDESLKRELARAERDGYPICIALLDIDHFKNINDKFGHAAGDIVLREIARLLLQNTRAVDIICRYGGEEFIVMMPKTNQEDAEQIAERWREVINGTDTLAEGLEIKATISCGISEFPTHGMTAVEVFEAADKALYTAKDGGRNQVVSWSRIKQD